MLDKLGLDLDHAVAAMDAATAFHLPGVSGIRNA
jgi:hypothetical protein